MLAIRNLITVCKQIYGCPVDWGCRIHRLHLCRGVRPCLVCSRYDTKQSNGQVPVLMELWGMQSTPSLPSLPGSFWPGVVAPNRILSVGQIKLNCSFESLLFLRLNCVFMLNWSVLIFKLCTYSKLNCPKKNCFWHWISIYAKLDYLK